MSGIIMAPSLQNLTDQLAGGYRRSNETPEQAGRTLCTIVPELPQLTERNPDIADLAVANINRAAVGKIRLRTTDEPGRVKLDLLFKDNSPRIVFRFDNPGDLVKTVTDFFNGAISFWGKTINDVYYRVLEFKDSLSNQVIKWSLRGREGEEMIAVDNEGKVVTRKLYKPVNQLLPYSQTRLWLRRMSEILPAEKSLDFYKVTGVEPAPLAQAAPSPETKLATLPLRDFDALLKDFGLIQQGLIEKKYTDAELSDRHPYMIVNNDRGYLRVEFHGTSNTSVLEILRSLAEGKAKLGHIKVDSFDTLAEAQTARALEQSKLFGIQDQVVTTKTNIEQFVVKNYTALNQPSNLALPYADQGY